MHKQTSQNTESHSAYTIRGQRINLLQIRQALMHHLLRKRHQMKHRLEDVSSTPFMSCTNRLTPVTSIARGNVGSIQVVESFSIVLVPAPVVASGPIRVDIGFGTIKCKSVVVSLAALMVFNIHGTTVGVTPNTSVCRTAVRVGSNPPGSIPSPSFLSVQSADDVLKNKNSP